MGISTRIAAAGAVGLLWVAGCGGDGGASSTPPLPRGGWAAAVTVPGGLLRFRMLVSGTDEAPIVDIANADERVRVGEVSADSGRYTFRFPAFNSTIEAALDGYALNGTLTLVKRGGVEQVMPFGAALVAGTPPPGPSDLDISGRWNVQFADDDGSPSLAVGEFVQNGNTLTGTFLTPTGDYRYLAGDVSGREFSLSCFDGAHAFLFTGQVKTNGTIIGDFWSGTRWHEKWVAVRDNTASLPDPSTLTQLHEGETRFAFDFPDVNREPVTSKDGRFLGKVVIVTLAGSWCPNCHDEAAFLASLYRAHHAAGLEAVGLMYEHYRDFERAAVQVSRYAEKHDIQYPLLVAGYSDKKEAAATLTALDRVVAFPTIIVIDRRGEVRRIHTGFTGPGTGAHYDAFRHEFTSFIEALLDEQP